MIRLPRFDRRELWRSLSVGALVRLTIGVFFIFAATGFVVDIPDPRSTNFTWVLVRAVFNGTVAVMYVFAFLRGPRFWAIAVIGQILGGFILARVTPSGAPLIANVGNARGLHTHLILDSTGVIVAITAGWVFLASFVNKQAFEHFQSTVELTVARRLQAELVPTVSLTTPRFEIEGRSDSSSQMGGDVIDVVVQDGGELAYVADVSGHGIAAGILMTVVKSAIRTNLLSPQPLSEMLRNLNTVLPGLKDPASYVTIAAVRPSSDGVIEYTLAGHLPILHFIKRTHSIQQLALSQVVLGMFPGIAYESATAAVEPGDLLILLTDGLTETFNHADEQFGVERLSAVIVSHANRQLSELVDQVFTAVRRHGPQADDQSLLVIRVRGE